MLRSLRRVCLRAQNGFFASAGPLEIFVSEKVSPAQPPNHTSIHSARPCPVLDAHTPHSACCDVLCSVVQLMPSDLKFDPGRESLPMFVSEEENVRIEAGSEVRVKIIGIRLAAEQIVVIGTIKEDFLG